MVSIQSDPGAALTAYTSSNQLTIHQVEQVYAPGARTVYNTPVYDFTDTSQANAISAFDFPTLMRNYNLRNGEFFFIF